MNMQDSMNDLKGVGVKTAALFSKLHIDTIGQLIRYYPRDYDHFDAPVAVRDLVAGKVMAIRARVTALPSMVRAKGFVITHANVSDESGAMRLTWFRMPYIRNALKPGTVHVFRGLVKKDGNGRPVMEHPRMFSEEQYQSVCGSWQPKYPLTAGITNHMIQKYMKQALSALSIQDYLPAQLQKTYGLIPLSDALEQIHFPQNETEVRAARRRLVFDEFLSFLVQIRQEKAINEQVIVDHPMVPVSDTARLIDALPYRLTGAQQRVWGEIEKDLQQHVAMNRLIQGDVGSGKTILAFLALLMCSQNGRQGCLMAPTEVLAIQHYEALLSLAEQYELEVHPVLLTGSMSAKQKKEIYEKTASGEADILIGTHALIQEGVHYRNLALVVTDEQHRFGVRQREALANKGDGVHLLVMSATPIPRTLAMVLYGDLHVSVLDEMPQNRLPIKNCVVDPSFRKKAYAFLKSQVAAGRQAYVICPMVEEGDWEGVENVIDYTKKLSLALPDPIRISALHGKMKAAKKQQIMEDFAAHRIDILVSTTVIEVGIDVPNATVMLVENAERFGLAQLHQLRGRVGRGKQQSFCIFMTGDESGANNKRLEVLSRSNDGFYIANEDLKLRGPGDLFGIRQSGALDFSLGDIYQDSDVLLNAGELAQQVVAGKVTLLKEGAGLFEKQIDYRTI